LALDRWENFGHYIRSGYMEPLTPAVFHVMLALVDGEKHGYGIMADVAKATSGEVKMGPGTLYGTLKRMLAAGLVQECPERVDPKHGDERRRYFQLTPKGLEAARAEAARLRSLVRIPGFRSLLTMPGKP
jgi:DNA-binding PadR family transcriptional regulator